MAAQKPFTRSVLLSEYTIPGSRAKVAKKKRATRNLLQPGLRRKDGLLNAVIPARSELMAIAKQNSLDSPLLRLPAEIRDNIWSYAVGYHQIFIWRDGHGMASPIGSSCEVRPRNFIRPTFQLQKVCRQIYVETSSLIYKLNTFGFYGLQAFDRWIKNRPLGQKRLITSVDVPFLYMRLYLKGFRKLFRKNLPNIKRIKVIRLAAQQIQDQEGGSLRQRFVDFVKDKEGENVDVI